MEDEAAGCLGYAFVIIFALVLAAALLPLAIYIAAMYYSGKRFRWQLQHYQLTEKSTIVLVAVGLICVLTIVGVFATSIESGLLAIPILALFFLGASVVILEIWAYIKRRRLNRAIERLGIRQGKLEYGIDTINDKIRELEKNVKEIEEKYGGLIRELNALDEKIKTLCRENVRAWALKKQEWEKAFSKLCDEEIEAKLRELPKFPDSYPENLSPGDIDSRLHVCILQREQLVRKISLPTKQLDHNNARVRDLKKRELSFQKKLFAVQTKRSTAEASLQETLEAKLVLD